MRAMAATIARGAGINLQLMKGKKLYGFNG